MCIVGVGGSLVNACRSGRMMHSKHTKRESPKSLSILRWLDDFSHWHEWMPNSEDVQLPYRDARTVYKFYMTTSRSRAAVRRRTQMSMASVAAARRRSVGALHMFIAPYPPLAST